MQVQLRRVLLPCLLLSALLLSLLAVPSHAQEGSGATIVIREVLVEGDGTTTVRVSVPPGVTEQDIASGITVQENANAITQFAVDRVTVQQEELRSEAALLIDISGSTRGEPLRLAKLAAAEFVQTVAGQGVPVTLITFDDVVTTVVRKSVNVPALQAAIGLLEETGGETALYDAIDQAASLLAEDPDLRERTITVFSDGDDTASIRVTAPADAASLAQDAGAAITVVSLTTPDTTGQTINDLRTLAEGTSGSVIEVTNTAGLGEALGQVAESITSQVVLTYFAENFRDPELTVTVALDTAGTILTDRQTVTNLRTIVPVQPPAQDAPIPQARIIEGTPALVLGLGAAAFAVALLGTTLLSAPSDGRSVKVLRRQFEPPAARASDAGPSDARIKERVSAVMDAVPKPSGFDERLQKQLDQASWPLRSGEFLALSIGLSIGGGVVGAIGLLDPVLGVTFALLGAAVPRLILIQRRQKRSAMFHDQLPDTLQMLAGSLRAGYGLMQGLDNVSREGQAPTATEFGRVLTETRLGIPLEDALAAMAERVGGDDFRWVTVAVSIQRKVGGNLAELLDTVAKTLREREQVRRQVNVLSAEGKLSAVILIALPIVFAIYLGASRPDYLVPLFTTVFGNVMLGSGVVLLFLGIIWIRAVIRIEV